MRAILRADGVLPGRLSRVAIPSSFRRGRPFADDTQAAGEAFRLYGPPERGAIVVAIRPRGLKLCQERFQRIHPAAEYVVTRAADDFVHQTTRFVGLPHDLSD